MGILRKFFTFEKPVDAQFKEKSEDLERKTQKKYLSWDLSEHIAKNDYDLKDKFL